MLFRSDGQTPGPAIRIVSRRLMDAFNPSWVATSSSEVVLNYTTDPQDVTAFFVYPPSDGTNYIEINYSALPAWLSTESTPMIVNAAYEDAIINYVMYRALSKNADFAANPLAAQYLGTFNTLLGAKLTAEQANNPNTDMMSPAISAAGGES